LIEEPAPRVPSQKKEGSIGLTAQLPINNYLTRGTKMVNSNNRLARGRKEGTTECTEYVDELTQNTDILGIALSFGMKFNQEGYAECPDKHGGSPTLRIDQETQTFRCMDPTCNDHGDVITLTQRILRQPFSEAVRSLANGSDLCRWIDEHPQEAITYGLIRDSMGYAARMFAARLDLASHFLTTRKIEMETARRFMLGRGLGKNYVTGALKRKGLDEDTQRQAGLLNQYGKDRFQNHVMVPIFRNGQVVDFYGRMLRDEDKYGKHWRLPGDRFILGHSLFNWDAHRKEIILVEGVFDALSLIEHGFDNAVAACGTNGLHEDMLVDSSLNKVWMCFDGDGPGRENGLKRAYQLKDAGLEVRIIDLPDGHDPNEFFMDQSSSDFKELMLQSSHPEVWEIEHIDPELDQHEQIHALENVMRRARMMEPMHKGALIKRVSKKLCLREKDVREHVESISEENNQSATCRSRDVIDLGQYELIHPALHFGPRGTLMGIPLMVTNPQTGRREWEPWVITSDGELFPITHEEINRRGYYCNDIVTPGRQRYSQQVITEFLEGSRMGDLGGTFNRIKSVFQRYLDFSDPTTYDYLTAWTIGTYFFPIFNYYPYLHFTGTKEVGKSKAMKLMSQLCFNGIMSVSITDASQFRIITELLPTLFLDETENLNDRTYSERRALLLGGYEKGSTAIRTERVGDTFKTREYDNYSPRVFGSIEGLEDTLASRTIQIPMRRSYNEQIKSSEVQLNNPEFEELRDELFLIAMTYGNQICSAYEQIQRPADAEFDAREWNLFKPILAIGASTGNSEVVQSVIEFANQAYSAKTEALNETSVENVILRCLKEIVQREDWYEFEAIHDKVIAFIKENGLNVGSLSKNRLGTLLRNLNVVDQKERRKIKGIKIVYYLIRPEQVRKVAENYRVK
jgi:DNA primase